MEKVIEEQQTIDEYMRHFRLVLYNAFFTDEELADVLLIGYDYGRAVA